MNVPEIYLDAALAEITLHCHQCDTSLDPHDLPPDQPRFGADGWYENLAAEALRRGWLIEYNAPDSSYFDYRIACPNCATDRGTMQ